MGFSFKKVGRAFQKATNQVGAEIRRTGENVAPLAQPVLTAVGAVVGGAAGATVGGQIGAVTGKALSGKSLKAGPEVELTINVVGGPLPEQSAGEVAPEPAPVNADATVNPAPATPWLRFVAWLAAFLRAMSDEAGVNFGASRPVALQPQATTTTESGPPTSYVAGPAISEAPAPRLFLPPSAILRKG